MKIWRIRWALMSMALLPLNAAIGQAQYGAGSYQPENGMVSYYEQNGDGAAPADGGCAAMPAESCDGSCGEACCEESCDACCQGFGCWPCGCALEDLGEANELFDCCAFECNNIQAGGWIAQSFTANPYGPADRFNGPVTWTDRSNEYQLNEIYAYIGKAADTGGCGWDYGYRADALYGTNYRWDTSSGWENNIGGGAFYGLANPQLYAEVARDDLTVKAGHFISPVGFYTVGTANNFFPVIPYTYQYGEPFTHTGILATQKFSDKLSVGGGITRGWDNSDDTNPFAGALGTVTYTGDCDDSLAWVGVYGKEPNLSGANGGFTTRYFQTLVYSKKFSEDITGVLQSDLGVQGDAVGATNKTAYWYGVNSYLYWNQTCRMQWGLNFEWFRDEEGFRVGRVLPSNASPDARGWAQAPGGATAGYNGNFYRITFGPRYFFTPNLYTRVAFLADFYQGGRDAAGQVPFDDGTKSHQQLGVFDLVYTF
jgi:hypothetical protein